MFLKSHTPWLGHDDLNFCDWSIVVTIETGRHADGDTPVGYHGNATMAHYCLGSLSRFGRG